MGRLERFNKLFTSFFYSSFVHVREEWNLPDYIVDERFLLVLCTSISFG